MKPINVADAKARLPELIEAALKGEEVIIARRGIPAVRLIGLDSAKVKPRFGRLAGKIVVGDDFDAPLEDFDSYR
jgi:prevent-host-death family protein